MNLVSDVGIGTTFKTFLQQSKDTVVAYQVRSQHSVTGSSSFVLCHVVVVVIYRCMLIVSAVVHLSVTNPCYKFNIRRSSQSVRSQSLYINKSIHMSHPQTFIHTIIIIAPLNMYLSASKSAHAVDSCNVFNLYTFISIIGRYWCSNRERVPFT
jgi:hypothetical protein